MAYVGERRIYVLITSSIDLFKQGISSENLTNLIKES